MEVVHPKLILERAERAAHDRYEMYSSARGVGDAQTILAAKNLWIEAATALRDYRET